jgi:hypothetical protein
MSHHQAGMASVDVGVDHGGGVNTFEFGYVTDRVLRDAASQMSLGSLDARVKEFGFLLRVSGTILVFEGQDVENVRFGRGRSYVSVDWLYAERITTIRDIETLISLVLARLRRTPDVVADVCKRRKVAIDHGLFTSECEQMGELITMYARDRERFEEWKEGRLEIERREASGYQSYF